ELRAHRTALYQGWIGFDIVLSGADLHEWLRTFCCHLGVKVLPFMVDDDEGREVFHLDAPDGLHAQLRIRERLDFLDAMLSQTSGRAADRAQIEATVFAASFPYLWGAISLREHHHAAAVALEQVDVGVHPPRRGGTEGA